jgi:pimeloyl-ACP methyl ester carboxylesterase
MSLPEIPELDGVRHSFVPVNGFRMHVAEAGASDGPVVVCLHGWPQSWWIWRHLMPVLAGAGYRVIAPDLRGHGWSETPAGGYEKSQFAADVVALLDALGLERVSLVGHDWGAMAGFMIAVDHPSRVDRYVALGIVPPFPSRSPVALLHVWRIYYQFILASPFSPFLVDRMGMLGKVFLPKGATRDEAFSDFDLSLYQSLLSGPLRRDVSRKVYASWLTREFPVVASGHYAKKGLSVPTRIVVGEHDPVCKAALIRGVEKYADDVAWEVLPGVGHFVPEEAPKETADRVLGFFGSAS